jgi:hypothetical protein
VAGSCVIWLLLLRLSFHSAHRFLLCLPSSFSLQVILGITTLLHYVPVSLGSAHQMSGMLLLSSGVYMLYTLSPHAYGAPRPAKLAAAAAPLLLASTASQRPQDQADFGPDYAARRLQPVLTHNKQRALVRKFDHSSSL